MLKINLWVCKSQLVSIRSAVLSGARLLTQKTIAGKYKYDIDIRFLYQTSLLVYFFLINVGLYIIHRIPVVVSTYDGYTHTLK